MRAADDEATRKREEERAAEERAAEEMVICEPRWLASGDTLEQVRMPISKNVECCVSPSPQLQVQTPARKLLVDGNVLNPTDTLQSLKVGPRVAIEVIRQRGLWLICEHCAFPLVSETELIEERTESWGKVASPYERGVVSRENSWCYSATHPSSNCFDVVRVLPAWSAGVSVSLASPRPSFLGSPVILCLWHIVANSARTLAGDSVQTIRSGVPPAQNRSCPSLAWR